MPATRAASLKPPSSMVRAWRLWYIRAMSTVEPQSLWNNLHEELRRSHAGHVGTRSFAPTALIVAGLESLPPGASYSWDGLKRGGDAAEPYLILQITLGGSGVFEAHGQVQTLAAGDAFAAIVPGPHRYYLPACGAGWQFFWVLVRHPYLAGRIRERQAEQGMAASVLHLAPDSPLVASAVRLFTGEGADALGQEQAAFDLLFRYERQVQAQVSPPAPERDALLSDLRRYTKNNLTRSFGVEEVARQWNLSRSHFSRHVKALTGQTPADLIAEVRLEEAARRLTHTDDTLTQIARATGFADANHLCKVFRRRYRLTPGTFRRQMRG